MKKEIEILELWKETLPRPLVSICCLAYNHEKYIEDAIRGFLIQETEFPFEIVIHDDASSDKTRKIIEWYAERYPKIIKPIYQIENQYSKSRNKVGEIAIQACSGKYIAFCEGDDYWIEPKKIHKQVGLMRQNPEIGISFHPAYKNEFKKSGNNQILANHSERNKIFTPEEVLCGGGEFMPTCSLLIKSEILKSLPGWYLEAPVGDLYIQAIAAQEKGALYSSSVSSVYRANNPHSWTATQNKMKIGDIQKEVISHQIYLKRLEEYAYTENQINKAIAREIFYSAIKALKINELRLFKSFIKLSNSYNKNKNFKIRLIGLLSNVPVFLWVIYKIKKIIN
jgi:glycosyltransferase involved in cell wall biosynthesis